MKWAILIVVVLLLSANIVYAETTKISGVSSAFATVTLLVTYHSGGIAINGQRFSRTANAYGDWELVLSSDSGEIKIEASDNNRNQTVTTPAGTPVTIDLVHEQESGSEPVTQTSNPNITSNSDTSTPNITITDTSDSSAISGNVIAEGDNKAKFDLGNFNIYLIVLILFIMMVLANLASHGIVNLIRKRKSDFRFGDYQKIREDKIKITKLSEKLAQNASEINKIIGKENH